jgi:hypothetical protein
MGAGVPRIVAVLKSIVVGLVTWWLLVLSMIGSSATTVRPQKRNNSTTRAPKTM